MHNPAEIFLLLLLAVCVIAVLATRLKVSPSIAMVLGGICLALIPGFPDFQIPPQMMLLIFLPVMLTEAAYYTSLRDFKRNIKPISQLAFGLVIFTAFSVAVVFHWLFPGAGWAGGFILGAIVSPPDAMAATSVIRGLRLPKRIVTILEGESLINDATGLVVYKFAVAAVLTGAFSLASASIDFSWMVISGVLIGSVIAILFSKIFPYIKQQSVEILSVFLVPYAAYIATEQVGGSGVLAVVVCAIVMFWFSARNFSSNFRLQSASVWGMVTFVMNGLVFLLIGLYFPSLVQRLSHIPPRVLIETAVLISFVVIATRFIWVYGVIYGQYRLNKWRGKTTKAPSWQNVFIIAWTGMRGVVTLATALGLPLTLTDGDAFPYRDLTIFLAFSVILVTLVVQGLTLPWIIKKLSLTYDPQVIFENWNARKQAAEQAASRLKAICERGTMNQAALERILSHYEDRIVSLGDGPNTPLNQNDEPDRKPHPIIEAENNIWQEVLQVERDAILQLRLKFEISDEVMHELMREIDLMETRFSLAA